MGLSGSSKSSTTTSGPSAAALPYINAASGALGSAFNAAQPTANMVGQSLFDQFQSFNQPRAADPNITAARGYVGDVLGGKYLSGNPELQNVINTTNDSVVDRVNAMFSRAGHSGSSRQIGELGKQLAANESGLRYQNYSDEQNRIGQALAQAMAMREADTSEEERRAATSLALGSGAVNLPLNPAQVYAGGLGSLWGNSMTTNGTVKESGSVIGSLGSLLSAAGSASAMFSDRRLKTDVVKVGTLPDGLGVYEYRYAPAPTEAVAALMPQPGGGDQIHRGVMADEVAQLRPWALGPVIDGYATVDYGAL